VPELPDAVPAAAEPQTRPAMLQRAAQPRPLAAVAVLPDAPAPEQEARALPQQEQVSPPVRVPKPIELRAQAEPVQPQALEELLERVQRASVPAQAAQRQVSPRLAALPDGVAAEPRPLPSSA
jgi:hypothetical protein